MVSDDFKVSLLSDIPHMKLPMEHVNACASCREASRMCAPHLSIMIPFLHDIIDHVLAWRREDIIQWEVAAATTHTHLGSICAVGLGPTINDSRTGWVVQFHRRLYLSSGSSVVVDWGKITTVWTTICSGLLLAAPKLLGFPAQVWQTSNCSVHY